MFEYKAEKTNVELVNEIMNYCPTGALGQIFVINALVEYTDAMLKQHQRPTDSGTGFIDNQAWWDTAKYINERIKQNYEKKPDDTYEEPQQIFAGSKGDIIE